MLNSHPVFDQLFPLNLQPAHRVKQRELAYEVRTLFEPFHQRNQRWACIVAHRRAGKTVACVNELIVRALYTKKKSPRYAYIGPFYAQAKEIAWAYLKEYAQPFIDDPRDIRESELKVTLFNGASIRLYGADNPDALRGVYFDGVIIDEYGDCRPSLWGEVIRPTLADRKGWAVFIGTPKGKNHFFQQRELARTNSDWFYAEFKASETGILDQTELDDIRSQLSEAEYEQEMECSFTAPLLGTYYAQIIQLLERDRQIQPGHPKHDPTQPVHVAADIGFTDSTALWFWQHAPDGIGLIDYYENQSKPLVHYLDVLDDRPYNYETIWLPHDARAKTYQTGRSTIEQFRDPPQHDEHHHPVRRQGYPAYIAPNLSRQQGIDAARLILPHCHFNQTTCYDGIEALRAYRRKYDEQTNAFSDQPLHDWAADGADAFRYLALVARERLPTTRAARRPAEGDSMVPEAPRITLDGLWYQTERQRFQFERDRI